MSLLAKPKGPGMSFDALLQALLRAKSLSKFLHLLREIAEEIESRRNAPLVGLIFSVRSKTDPAKEKLSMALLDLKDNEFATFQLVLLKADGTPGTVDGAPVWDTMPDATLVTVAFNPDNLGGTLTAVNGAAGTTTIGGTVDADLGPGVTSIQFVGSISKTITTDNVTSVELTFGAPQPVPAPTPVP
jgi:hypothetical protein